MKQITNSERKKILEKNIKTKVTSTYQYMNNETCLTKTIESEEYVENGVVPTASLFVDNNEGLR